MVVYKHFILKVRENVFTSLSLNISLFSAEFFKSYKSKFNLEWNFEISKMRAIYFDWGTVFIDVNTLKNIESQCAGAKRALTIEKCVQISIVRK